MCRVLIYASRLCYAILGVCMLMVVYGYCCTMDDKGAEDWDAVRVVSCTKCIPHTLPHTHTENRDILLEAESRVGNKEGTFELDGGRCSGGWLME